MGIEQKISFALAEEMALEIDFQILAEVFEKIGWIKITLDTLGSMQRAVDMKLWAESEGIVKRGLFQQGRIWLFKEKEDAILFKLTWS